MTVRNQNFKCCLVFLYLVAVFLVLVFGLSFSQQLGRESLTFLYFLLSRLSSPAEINVFFETNTVQHLALIFEDAQSYVGREVTCCLDFLFACVAEQMCFKNYAQILWLEHSRLWSLMLNPCILPTCLTYLNSYYDEVQLTSLPFIYLLVYLFFVLLFLCMCCGYQVTLDLLQFENIAVRRVLTTEKDLVTKLGVTDFPSCYLYYPAGNFTRLTVWVSEKNMTYPMKPAPTISSYVLQTQASYQLNANRDCDGLWLTTLWFKNSLSQNLFKEQPHFVCSCLECSLWVSCRALSMHDRTAPD